MKVLTSKIKKKCFKTRLLNFPRRKAFLPAPLPNDFGYISSGAVAVMQPTPLKLKQHHSLTDLIQDASLKGPDKQQ